MNLNATLLVQMLVFMAFVILTMRFIWKPLTKVLEDRREKIAEGLAAAEKGQKDLAKAQEQSEKILAEIKMQAAQIIEQANQRANNIIEEARIKAKEEGHRLLQLTQDEVEKAYYAAREQLLKQVTNIAVQGAEKILKQEIDKASNDRLINQFVSEI